MKAADAGKAGDHFGAVGGREIDGHATLAGDLPLPLVRSVSATTRPPRPGESDGVDYHFLTKEEFDRRRAGVSSWSVSRFSGADIGMAPSARDHWPCRGKWVVLEIDVEGAIAVLEQYPDAITIFVHSGSLAESGAPLCGNAERNRKRPSRGGWTSRTPEMPWRTATATRSSITRSPLRHREICDVLKRYGVSPEQAHGSTRGRNQPPRECEVHARRTERRRNRQQGRRPFQALDADPETPGAAQRRQPAAGHVNTENKMEVVIQEIMQDKIYLDSSTK